MLGACEPIGGSRDCISKQSSAGWNQHCMTAILVLGLFLFIYSVNYFSLHYYGLKSEWRSEWCIRSHLDKQNKHGKAEEKKAKIAQIKGKVYISYTIKKQVIATAVGPAHKCGSFNYRRNGHKWNN